MQGSIFIILQHFATKLCDFTIFNTLFPAVVIIFVLLAKLKMMYNRNCPFQICGLIFFDLAPSTFRTIYHVLYLLKVIKTLERIYFSYFFFGYFLHIKTVIKVLGPQGMR